MQKFEVIKTYLKNSWFVLRSDKVFLVWGIFVLYLIVAYRIFCSTKIALSGFLDDAYFLCVTFLTLLLLSLLPPWFRAISVLAWGALLLVFHITNLFFYTFFQSTINLDAIAMSRHVGAAQSSVESLFTHEVILFQIALPALFLLGAIYLYLKYKAPKGIGLTPIFVGGLLCTFGCASLFKSVEYVAAENNPLGYLTRQALTRVYEEHFLNPEDELKRMHADAAQTYSGFMDTDYEQNKDFRYPLMKAPKPNLKSKPNKKNVVIVLMESVRFFEMLEHPDGENIAPHLNALAKESMFFDQFYYNGIQTVRGELAILCSVLPNNSGGQIYSLYPYLSTNCLPRILQEEGYNTHWISSYDSKYMNKEAFLSVHGVESFHDIEELKGRPKRRPKVGWGASDEDLMDFAVDVLDGLEQPFFAEVMTLSNHHPWHGPFEIPSASSIVKSDERALYRNYLRGMQYTDHAVGQFVRDVKTKSWFKNTVFVFVGDHSIWVMPEKWRNRPLSPAEKNEIYFRGIFMIWAPGLVEPETKSMVSSQIDVAPTLMSLLGFSASNAFTGANLLTDAPKERRWAMMVGENAWNYRRDDQYCYALGQSCFETIQPRCSKGETPSFTGHLCFESEESLLSENNNVQLKKMSQGLGADLLEEGKTIIENNRFLLRTDSFFPPEEALQ